MYEISNMMSEIKLKHEENEILNLSLEYEIIENNRKNNSRNIFIMQTYILIKKTLLVFARNIKNTLFMFLSPFIICLFLVQLQNFLDNYSQKYVQLNPDTISLNNNLIPKCNKPKNCTTILGIVIDKSKNEYNKQESYNIMSYVAKENNLTMNEDVKLSSISTYTEFSNYLKNNKNKTFYGVIFCYDNLDVNTSSLKLIIPCVPEIKKEKELNRFYIIVYKIILSPNPLKNRAKEKYIISLLTVFIILLSLNFLGGFIFNLLF